MSWEPKNTLLGEGSASLEHHLSMYEETTNALTIPQHVYVTTARNEVTALRAINSIVRVMGNAVIS